MPVATTHAQHSSTREQTHLSLVTSLTPPLLHSNNNNSNTTHPLSPRDLLLHRLTPSSATDHYYNHDSNTSNTLQDALPNTQSSGTTMKTDRKVDPVSLTSTSSATTKTTTTATASSSRRNSHTAHNNKNATTTTKTNSRKRKAANSDLHTTTNNRRNSHFSDDAAATTTTKESLTADDHVHFITASSAKQIGRDSSTRHHDKTGDGEEYVIAVSSGRRKRVLVSPVAPTATATATATGSRLTRQQQDMDLDNSDVDVVTVDEVVPRKKSRGHGMAAALAATAAPVSNPSTETVVVAPAPTPVTKSKSSKRNATDTTTTTTSDTSTTSKTAATTAASAKVSGATTIVAEACPVSEEGDKAANNKNDMTDPSPTTPAAKKSRKNSTTTTKGTTKSGRSKSTAATAPATPAAPTTPTPTSAPTPAVSTPTPATPTANAASPAPDGVPQKRVLPSRGGGLRDKNTIPIEPSLLEPPPVPAGEYILYLADQQTFQRATLDPRRVPPASYGGAETPLPAEPTTATAGDTIHTQPSTLSTPPPSATTHIEVPIFKLCSINQFLQEEKKRKMQLLTKALAKAEADAAAEAKALAQSEATPSATPRPVSTRQKHKAIVHNQQVSVQTAVPSFFSSSSSHAKRATTTSTTVGKIEGAVGGSGGAGGSHAIQEENLSDEVYEKRHRKQEMAEKKLKNREKEKLRHAMYQQQLVVEKLRNMEVNRLMPISAFRTLQKTIELEQQLKEANASLDDSHQHHSNSISLAAAKMMQDEYHRRLLQEAEENLRRYEQMGLADSANISSAPAYSPFSRTKNRLVAMTNESDEEEQAPIPGHSGASSDKKDRSSHRSHSNGLAPSETRRKRPKTTDAHMEDVQDSAAPQRRRKKLSAASSGDATSTPLKSPARSAASAKPTPSPVVEPPRPPKPITTFIKPGSILASGSRKSYRVTLAFGEKVPTLDRFDFDLPLDVFGDLIRERFGDSEPVLQQQQQQQQQPLNGSSLKIKKQHQRQQQPASAETGTSAVFTSVDEDTEESQEAAAESSSVDSSSTTSSP